MWEPGDRIYLFGFSRGAYTARCVAGVLFYCGVPTKMKDGSALKRDPKSAKAEYGSGNTASSNCSPYFIGVWDTVATLGAGGQGIAMVLALHILLAGLIAAVLNFGLPYLPFGQHLEFSYSLIPPSFYWRTSCCLPCGFNKI